MPGTTVNVQVFVHSRIPQLIAGMYAYHRTALGSSADRVVKSAKARAPVKSGYLRSSIRKQIVKAGFEAEIIVDAPYAAFQEFGTVHHPAHPYLYPAMLEEEHIFIHEMSWIGFK